MTIPEDMILKEGDALDLERDWIVDHLSCRYDKLEWRLLVYDTTKGATGYFVRDGFPTLEEAILYGESQGSRLRIADFEIDLVEASRGITKRFRGDCLPLDFEEAT
jgi:hypothetical protein